MKLLLSFGIFSLTMLFANVENMYPTVSFLHKNITTIDIRTKGEWLNTGIFPNSIPISFFDRNHNYNAKKFLKELNKAIENKNSKFAVICRSGHRSGIVTKFLDSKGYSNVINLQGGVKHFTKILKMKLEPYNPNKKYY
jgi:rhodanese-related sulfurtransferase